MVRVEDVREIVPLLALEEVEGRAGLCRGLINLRGESIPVFDLCGRDAPLLPSRFILVTRSGASPAGLIVDEVHDVVNVPAAELVRRPVGGEAEVTVARIEDALLTVLEPADALRASR